MDEQGPLLNGRGGQPGVRVQMMHLQAQRTRRLVEVADPGRDRVRSEGERVRSRRCAKRKWPSTARPYASTVFWARPKLAVNWNHPSDMLELSCGREAEPVRLGC
jgi:hypothetical protein